MTNDRPHGYKHDSEKPRFSLLIQGLPLALTEVTNVLTYGSNKYADHNWIYVDNADERYLSASMRHEIAFSSGEQLDPESHLHHLAHKICSDLFRLELILQRQKQRTTEKKGDLPHPSPLGTQ